MNHLLNGRYEEGWREFEWRKRIRIPLGSRPFSEPLWLGEQDIAGKIILLHSEQGLGDTIQFCRYAELVSNLGVRVILEVPKSLMRLFEGLCSSPELIEVGSQLPFFDFHCPLMSLPLAFKTTLSSIPANIPYLKTDTDRVLFWNGRLGHKNKPRVGLVWSGGFRPDQPQVWSVNKRRNIPLAKFASFAGLDIDFYSLQKGEPAESELTALKRDNWGGPNIIDLTGELIDFSDTAALIQNLDLVISVDTSTAHLAGALGKPIWILNRFDTDWRWLLDRTDSPWYPTVKLYRQEKAGDWDEVVQRVRGDLIRV